MSGTSSPPTRRRCRREVFRALFDALRFLSRELSARRDIAAHLDRMINASYAWPAATEGIWQAHSEALQRFLRPIADSLPGIQVPVVLFVMNQAEAQALAGGSAFDGVPQDLRDEFLSYSQGLPLGWVDRYASQPEDMAVFGDDATIRDRVRAVLAQVDDCPEPLLANFLDPRTLDRRSLTALRSRGCVVVVDAISTRHPKIQRLYRDSFLDSSEKSLVVRVEPTRANGAATPAMNALVEAWFTSEFQYRLQEDDRRYMAVSDWPGFRRWMRHEVPRSIQKCGSSEGVWGVFNLVGR